MTAVPSQLRPEGLARVAEPETHVLALPDGRRIAWCEYGVPDGPPVLYFHGFPGSRLEPRVVEEEIARAGIRLIAPDRPGIGRSDALRGRRLLDWPADVARLADGLGVGRFACLGASGGGPYALACARELAARLTGVAVVCGLGPPEDRASRRAMILVNRVGMALGRGPAWLLRMLLAPQAVFLRRFPDRAIDKLSAALPAVDRSLLADPVRRSLFAASLEESLRQGARGLAREGVIYSRPWGFALEEVTVEVQLDHGELDRNVPISMARFVVSRLPRCRARFHPREGHYSLVLGHLAEILGRLPLPPSGAPSGTGDRSGGVSRR